MGKKGKGKDGGDGIPPPAAQDPPAAESTPATADTAPAPEGAGQEEQPTADDLSLEDLRELGAIASESQDGPHVDVLTKGGARLRFPGDEQKAGAMEDEQLFGPAAAAADPAATQVADEAAIRGDLSPTERAMAHWGLEKRHVLGSKEHPQDDGSIDVVIVTQGGQKLRWPRDAARVLSEMEKGDAVPKPQPGGIFTQAAK